jgi:hypothetical protein
VSVGNADVVDDQSIPDEAWALRRVHRDQWNNGRPDSSVFKTDNNGVGTSVTILKTLADVDVVLRGFEGYGLVAVRVAQFRALGLGIAYTFEEGNENHCEVFGARSKQGQRQLAKESIFLRIPEGRQAEAQLVDPSSLL